MTPLRPALAVASALLLASPGGAALAQPARPPASAVAPAAPLFEAALAKARALVDPALAAPPAVPVPKDSGGGYTHERHKANYRIIHDAGMLYRQTGDRRYADLIRRMLLAYGELYPTLGDHPAKAGQAPGRLFWQGLNDSVWLTNAIQGYAQVKDAIPAADRAAIEARVFRPMAKFLTESPSFDRIHNHGTWSVAAVGMTGYTLGDATMVRQALLGTDGSGKAGFLRQVDELFSPDGYYAEGPYYQRYALVPFVLFAKAIQDNEPARRIFERRDGVLVKAVTTNIQSTYAGRFFPINDALKDKGLDGWELITGVGIAYSVTKDPTLLSVARAQGEVLPTPEGREVAAALAQGRARPFPYKSLLLRDGPKGDHGALAILRTGEGPGHQALVFKATSQGQGHGHFDKLSYLFYDAGREVALDYGAARFLNVEAKSGGRYLPENDSWAIHTVGHNTLVVDETSHFGGDWRKGEERPPKLQHFGAKNGVQLAAATAHDAYDGVRFGRVMALVDRPEIGRPVVLDIVRARSGAAHQYDLPLYYQGALTAASTLSFTGGTTSLAPLGKANGYQHLWDRGRAPAADGAGRLAWFDRDRFYTYTFASNGAVDQVILAELGANDPAYNLRHERSFILRGGGKREFEVVSVLEPHGEYSAAEEYARDTRPNVAAVKLESADGKDVALITTADGKLVPVGVSYDPDPRKRHTVRTASGTYSWTGFFDVATVRLPSTPLTGARR